MGSKLTGDTALWLSDRVLDLRLKGHGFKTHQGHCIVAQ